MPLLLNCKLEMENSRANLIAFSIIILLIIIIIIARLTLILSETFFLICGASVAFILTTISILIFHNTRHPNLQIQRHNTGRDLCLEYTFLCKLACLPTKFRYRELEEATHGFRTLIGRGASGCVYKGLFADGTTAIAVKRIDGEERGERTFMAEVTAIASIQHVNLVRLLGYSITSTGPRFLVYEYVSNGSLENWIFPKLFRTNSVLTKSGCLTWEQRCGVAVDVARALSYLHYDCRSCILHLDVKPANILLDGNYRALVADFGLSKLKNREESRVIMTDIRGTSGYLAPEWLLENGISEKCDVYSYGMVLLEIIGGRRNIVVLEQEGEHSTNKFQFFPKIVVEKLKEGKLMEIVDERLVGNGCISERELKKMVKVALWCIQEKPELRPSMTRVVEMLEERRRVATPPDTQMLVVDLMTSGNYRPGYRRPRLAQLDRESTSMPGCSFSILSGR